MNTTQDIPGRDTTVREQIKDIWFEEFDFIKNPNMPEDLLDNLVNYVTAEKRQLEKAYGGCHNCYGKGYATVNEWARGGGHKWKVDNIKPCTCDRGKQFAELKAALQGDTGALHE